MYFRDTPTPAAEIAKPIENLGETRGRVQELRVKMRAFGNVNLDAVDEFQRVQERYSFLREQKDDLETAQTDLRRVIEQLTNQHEVSRPGSPRSWSRPRLRFADLRRTPNCSLPIPRIS